MGSIIGSGWLFGAQEALGVAGPAALISWVIGGIAILVLAVLTHTGLAVAVILMAVMTAINFLSVKS